MVSKIDEFDEANVAAVGRSWATSSEKQGPDKILKDLGLIRFSTNWDKIWNSGVFWWLLVTFIEI